MTDETPDEDIHVASEESQIMTTYEPGFDRVFARGSLIRLEDDDPDTLQLGFWSSKEDIDFEEEEVQGTGYRLETEVMMTWDTAVRLRKLLNNYIKENAPDEYTDSTE